VEASRVIDERLGTEGGVKARGVVIQRGKAIGGIVGTGLVAEERLVSSSRVAAASGVAKKRANAPSAVL
jgi:hypothetical protein